jgi:hypothetical protein
MRKPPEEGKIWEWRAFGKLPHDLLAGVNSLPIRDGIIGRPDNDVYLITPTSDHNIKLRDIGGRSVLKLKLLLESSSDFIELYQESMDMVYDFPVSKSVFDHVCSLLKTAMPGDLSSVQSFGAEGFIRTLSACKPPAKKVDVAKTRSQYVVQNGWVELADMLFPHKRTQSISVHSYQKEVVKQTINELRIHDGLKVMNYVQACRMWG